MGHYGTRVVRDSVALQIVDDKTRSDWNIQIKVTHQRIAFRTSLIRYVFAVNRRCELADCLFGSPRQVRHIITVGEKKMVLYWFFNFRVYSGLVFWLE